MGYDPPNHSGEAGLTSAVALIVFVMSGFAGLIYEIVWIRRAGLILGSTVFGLSTVLAIFFAGLAVGSLVIGRRSARWSRPFRAYAVVEILIGILGFLSLPALNAADSISGWLYHSVPAGPALNRPMTVILVALALFPATLLLGGTLPLMARILVRERSHLMRRVGLVYGLNTLGAAAGCLTTGFILLPRLGVPGSVMLAAGLNGLAAIMMFAMREPSAFPADVSTAPPLKSPASPADSAGFITAIVFVSGLTALSLEVLWTRYLSLLIPNTIHATTLTLAMVLIGIVLGSLVAAALPKRAVPGPGTVGLLLVLAALGVLVVISLPVSTWLGLKSRLLVCAGLLLPASILSGALFPVAVRMVTGDPSNAARMTGAMAAANTLGGIVGAIVTAFVVLPGIGLQKSFYVVCAVNLVAGVVAFALTRRGILYSAMALAMAGLILFVSRTRLPTDALARPGELFAYREGLESNLAVVHKDGRWQLEINRLWQGQDRPTHQIMAGHIPMLLHHGPRRVLVVGAGAGQTPERMLMHDPDRLDVVDIEPAVFDLIRDHFGGIRWMNDPRVRLIRADGRHFLLYGRDTYDVISLEVGQLFRPGAASFYTADFYEKIRGRLRPGGLVSQFLPLPFLTVTEFRSVIRTFQSVFPNCALWYNTSELLMMGVAGDRFVIPGNPVNVGQKIHDDLRFNYWGGTRYPLNRDEVFLAGYLAGPQEMVGLAGNAPLLTDDRPSLEYEAAAVPDTALNEIPIAALIRNHLAPVTGILSPPSLALRRLDSEAARAAAAFDPDSAAAEIVRIRDLNLGDLEAAAHLRRFAALGPSTPLLVLQSVLTRAARANPENVLAGRLLGDVMVLRGAFPHAKAFYEEVLRRDPGDLPARRGLAFVFQQTGLPDSAVFHFRKVLQLKPDDAETHNNLAAALSGTDPVEARKHWEEALRLRPDYAEARANLERLGATSGVTPGSPTATESPSATPPKATGVRLSPDWGTETCAYCKMFVEQPGFAVRADAAAGTVFFDDAGCVALWLATQTKESPPLFFHHVRDSRWIPEGAAAFVRHPSTPMDFGYAAVDAGETGSISFAIVRQRIAERFLKK